MVNRVSLDPTDSLDLLDPVENLERLEAEESRVCKVRTLEFEQFHSGKRTRIGSCLKCVETTLEACVVSTKWPRNLP